jgi:predicted DNA-binding transcriptional regulator YafY
MRADRLLAVLLLLQRRKLVTIAELARRLEVSPRTVHRDLEALGAAGIPVYSQPGRGGGVGMLESYRTDLTGLSLGEAELLPLLGLGDALSAMGLQSSLAQTETKVLAALPEAQRERAEDMRRKIHVDLSAWWHGAESVEQMTTLTQAAFTSRRVRVRYARPGAPAPVSRTLDPLGLVLKSGVWYLIARADSAGEPRTYRASRVIEAEVLDEHFEVPDGFELASFWSTRAEEFQNTGTAYRVVVRALPDAARVLRGERDTEALARGWQTVELTFGHKHHALSRLLSFGSSVVVESPDDLRADLAEAARSTAALYLRA